MAEYSQEKKSAIDYIFILYKWKKFLLINSIIIIVLSIAYSLSIPETFKATARITLPNQQTSSLGGIGSLISGNSSSFSFNSILGLNSPNQDLILGLLNSRTLLTSAIQKFNLMDYYEIDDRNMDKTLKAFGNDVIFEPNENGLIEISTINKNPIEAAEISNFFVHKADSLNIALNIEQARSNRDFIEKRYEKNVRDLKQAEDSMYRFQKQYGIYAVPEQLVTIFQTAGSLEAELLKQEIAAEYAKNLYGKNSSQYKSLENQLEFIRSRITELKNSESLSYPANVLVPFEKLPKIIEKYFRYYREIDIQTKIMEFLLPMYEQAKVDEQKSIPTLIVVDNAVPPDLKYAPKKAFIVLFCLFIGLFIQIPFVFIGEKYISIEKNRNILTRKLGNFYEKLRKIYKIKDPL